MANNSGNICKPTQSDILRLPNIAVANLIEQKDELCAVSSLIKRRAYRVELKVVGSD